MASENSFGFMAENKNSAVLIPCVACFQTSSNLNPSYTFELIFCLNFLLLLLLFFSISFFFFLFSFFFAQQNPKRKNNNNNRHTVTSQQQRPGEQQPSWPAGWRWCSS